MYNVGIIGHRSGDFRLEENIVKSRVEQCLDVLKFQYERNLILVVDDETGIEQFVIDSALKFNIKYHMFLSSLENKREATNEQDNKFNFHYNNSSATTVVSDHYSKNACSERDKKLINSSNFIICFWEGKKQGRAYNCIKYALQNNKIVLNGLDELKLISLKNKRNYVR